MSWSTQDEIRFINLLGTNGGSKALKGYRNGNLLRRVWTGLEREKIMQYTDSRIAFYESNEKKESGNL